MKSQTPTHRTNRIANFRLMLALTLAIAALVLVVSPRQLVSALRNAPSERQKASAALRDPDMPSLVPATACTAPPSGLVGWWPGENNANDIQGTNNGTLQNGATATATGKVGQAFSFDGVNDFVNVPTSATLDPTTTASMDAWVNFTQTPLAAGRYMTIMSKGSGSPGGDFDLLASPVDNKFYFYAGNGFNVASTTVI